VHGTTIVLKHQQTAIGVTKPDDHLNPGVNPESRAGIQIQPASHCRRSRISLSNGAHLGVKKPRRRDCSSLQFFSQRTDNRRMSKQTPDKKPIISYKPKQVKPDIDYFPA